MNKIQNSKHNKQLIKSNQLQSIYKIPYLKNPPIREHLKNSILINRNWKIKSGSFNLRC